MCVCVCVCVCVEGGRQRTLHLNTHTYWASVRDTYSYITRSTWAFMYYTRPALNCTRTYNAFPPLYLCSSPSTKLQEAGNPRLVTVAVMSVREVIPPSSPGCGRGGGGPWGKWVGRGRPPAEELDSEYRHLIEL